MFLFLPVRKEKGAWAGQGVHDELRGECDFIQDKLGKNNKTQQSLEKCKKSLKKTWSQRSQERAGVRGGEEKASGRAGGGQVP